MSHIRNDLSNSAGDYAHSTVMTALSTIPFVGGAASELFSLVIAPPVSKRRDEWLIQLAEDLQTLREKIDSFEIETLQHNEVFISTVLHATQIALRNHHTEKLAALRNAVLNSAVGIDIEENLQLMYLNLIDSLTPWHLNILSFFRSPSNWFKERGLKVPELMMGSPAQVLLAAYPELRDKKNFYELVVKDLYGFGLLNTDSIHVMMSGSGAIVSRTTDFGIAFINYISSPIEKGEV